MRVSVRQGPSEIGANQTNTPIPFFERRARWGQRDGDSFLNARKVTNLLGTSLSDLGSTTMMKSAAKSALNQTPQHQLTWWTLKWFQLTKLFMGQETVHRYYCNHCKDALYGKTAGQLAVNLNIHNNKMHPLDCCRWTSIDIVTSACYSGPSSAPAYLQKYVHPTTPEWGDAPAPIITERDKILLSKGGVKWG